MNTKLISLDTSTKSTGVAIYLNGKLFEYKCFNFSNILSSEERLEMMTKRILDFLSEENPQIVVLETTSVSRNVQTQRFLTMIIGAIYGLCVSNDIFYYSFRPSEWRSLVSSEKRPKKRDELKQWGIEKVKSIFDLEISNDDISDAILIGHAYIKKFSKE